MPDPADQMSDHMLVASFKDEQLKAASFTQLVKKYQERLYWHIRRMVIEHEDTNDILQNVFIKVWKNLESFKEASSLYTWLYRIATNESLTFIKQKKANMYVPFDSVSRSLSRKLEDDAYFSGDAIQKKLQQAILTLPDKQRIVFNMKYFENIKYEQMSQVLDTSVGALKASYHHAVKKIEVFLKNN